MLDLACEKLPRGFLNASENDCWGRQYKLISSIEKIRYPVNNKVIAFLVTHQRES